MGFLRVTCILMVLVVCSSGYPYFGFFGLRFRELIASITRGTRLASSGKAENVQVSVDSPCGTCEKNHCCLVINGQPTCQKYKMTYSTGCTYDLYETGEHMAVTGKYYPGKTECPCWTGLFCAQNICNMGK